MNWDIVEGNWEQFKGKVKGQWRSLTEEHLVVIAGKRVELAGIIQETYGTTREEAEAQIRRFEDRNKDYRP
ncbi:CsbD family protein [Accumulibacter sp.]|uniref:CsbD family protein n=1 Tax=Accumulibacter sp. TaxID=2053492 RepID=UPI0028C3D981|nr:CsbD family protein [Accumulibacter sp.]